MKIRYLGPLPVRVLCAQNALRRDVDFTTSMDADGTVIFDVDRPNSCTIQVQHVVIPRSQIETARREDTERTLVW